MQTCGSEINLHIIIHLKSSSIIYLFVFFGQCETATKVRSLRNISRHVEKHFRGKLQQTSLSADINENEWKQKKKTHTHTKNEHMQTARFKKSSLGIINCLKVSSTIYLFINLFICFSLLAIFAVRSSGTAEAIHTARLLQLVPLIRGA